MDCITLLMVGSRGRSCEHDRLYPMELQLLIASHTLKPVTLQTHNRHKVSLSKNFRNRAIG